MLGVKPHHCAPIAIRLLGALLTLGCNSDSTTPSEAPTTEGSSAESSTHANESTSSTATSNAAVGTTSSVATTNLTSNATNSDPDATSHGATGESTSITEASDTGATLTTTAADAGVPSLSADGSSIPNTTTDTSTTAGDAGVGSLPALTIASDTASIEFTPALYAAQNLYAGEASVISGGIPVLLSDTSVDLGTNAETQTLRRSVERPDLRIIFTVTETFYRIIARRSAGISRLADLAGKRIGAPAQTSAAFYVSKTLALAGLEVGSESDQVTVTSVFPGEQMVTALSGNNPTVEAVAAWEPYPQLALDALGGTGNEGDGIVFQDRDVYREIVNLHSTEAKLADPTTRRGIVAFVRALIQAAEWYRDNPSEAQAFVADTLGHEPDLMARVWEDERFGGILAPDLLDVLEEEEVWLAGEESRTPRTRDELAPLVDDSVVAEAMSGL